MESLDHREAALRKAMLAVNGDNDFLDMLCEAARVYGHWGDYTEVRQFVQWCYETAGLPIPTREQLEPYKD